MRFCVSRVEEQKFCDRLKVFVQFEVSEEQTGFMQSTPNPWLQVLAGRVKGCRHLELFHETSSQLLSNPPAYAPKLLVLTTAPSNLCAVNSSNPAETPPVTSEPDIDPLRDLQRCESDRQTSG